MRISAIILAVLIVTLPFLATDAIAGEEIYRWVDDNGVVHFGDQPPANTDAELIAIQQSTSTNTPPAPESTTADPDQPLDPQPSYAQQLRDERALRRAETAENDRIIAEACAQRRTIVSQLEPSTRVMVKSEDGTVTRMDDNVRLEKLNEAQTYIAENCNK